MVYPEASEIWLGYSNKNISFRASSPRAVGSSHQQTMKQGLCLLLIAGQCSCWGEHVFQQPSEEVVRFLSVELSEMCFYMPFPGGCFPLLSLLCLATGAELMTPTAPTACYCHLFLFCSSPLTIYSTALAQVTKSFLSVFFFTLTSCCPQVLEIL